MLTDSSKVALDAALAGPGGGTLRDKLSAFAARSRSQRRRGRCRRRCAGQRAQAAGGEQPRVPVREEPRGRGDQGHRRRVPERTRCSTSSSSATTTRYPSSARPTRARSGEESGYVPPVQSNSPSEASLRRDFVLSQDRYGSKTSISLPWNDFPVPGLAVGRLVETATEIAGVIDAYVAADRSCRRSTVTGDRLRLPRGRGGRGQGRARRGDRRRAGDALITPNGDVAAGSGVVDGGRNSRAQAVRAAVTT